MHKRKTQYVSTPAAPVTGDGILDSFKSGDFDVAVGDNINRYGDEQITGITICRTPLQAALNWIMSKGTAGHYDKVMKKENYNAYFHLALYITTTNSRYILEKNATINFSRAGPRSSKADIIDVVGQFSTVKQMLELTKQRMGSKFHAYNASNNNCQSFISAVLLANGITNEEYQTFVVQDTRSIFANSPFFRRFVNSVTDVGSVAPVAMEAAKGYVSRLPSVQIASAIMQPKKTMRRIRRGVRKFFGGDLGDGGFSRAGLMRKTKAELVEMILEMQE